MIIWHSAGYPIISHFTEHKQSFNGGFNVGGINASGQIPSLIGGFGVIDPATPTEAHTKKDYINGNDWQLVFSDEFNTPGRTFWPGDDPYWEAVNLHYWQTGNLEWYDPTAVTTKDGALEITLSNKPKNDLNYTGGMLSTWNKFCFQGGLLEVNVSLPGAANVVGLWPAVWTMGNLGRAGYGATLEGTVSTLPRPLCLVLLLTNCLRSGRIRTTRATLAPSRTRVMAACLTTPTASPTYPARSFRAALAQGQIIQVRCMTMGHT